MTPASKIFTGVDGAWPRDSSEVEFNLGIIHETGLEIVPCTLREM
jgi:hypothetical protein